MEFWKIRPQLTRIFSFNLDFKKKFAIKQKIVQNLVRLFVMKLNSGYYD